MSDVAGGRDMLTPVLNATERVIKQYRSAGRPSFTEGTEGKMVDLLDALESLSDIWGDDE